MKAENETSQKAQKIISTPTLIIIIAGLALLGYLLLEPQFVTTKEKAVTDQPLSVNKVQSGKALTPVAANNEAGGPLDDFNFGNKAVTSSRDPFLPSALVSDTLAPPKPPRTEQVGNAALPKKPSQSQLAWKGIVGTGINQVIMIQYNNRTYTLHLGELVPGTQYILAEVTADSVLLISPTGQKRLYRKKEAKING
ncbi:MAG TPA: hypothetical protein VIM29_11225 [Bacillota bacterium]